MRLKLVVRNKAIQLRENGLSYSEILKQINVSKSSLSLWLRETKLNPHQVGRLLKKQLNFRELGAAARRNQRIEKTKNILAKSMKEIGEIDKEKLFLIGTALYWAEGAKARGTNLSQAVEFSNSDPNMCKLFLKWLIVAVGIPKDRIKLSIYIHESQKSKRDEVVKFWSKLTGFSVGHTNKIYFTKTIYPRTKQRSQNSIYCGQLRIKVKRSTDLNRQISGWVRGIFLKSQEL